MSVAISHAQSARLCGSIKTRDRKCAEKGWSRRVCQTLWANTGYHSCKLRSQGRAWSGFGPCRNSPHHRYIAVLWEEALSSQALAAAHQVHPQLRPAFGTDGGCSKLMFPACPNQQVAANSKGPIRNYVLQCTCGETLDSVLGSTKKARMHTPTPKLFGQVVSSPNEQFR